MRVLRAKLQDKAEQEATASMAADRKEPSWYQVIVVNVFVPITIHKVV